MVSSLVMGKVMNQAVTVKYLSSLIIELHSHGTALVLLLVFVLVQLFILELWEVYCG